MSNQDVGEGGSEEKPDVASTYNPTTIGGQVRFWLSDTGANDCWMFSDIEIANLLVYARYPGQASDIWATQGDVQVLLSQPHTCPYALGDAWRWFGWWDTVYRPLYAAYGIRLYIFQAAMFGWQAIANDAALLAKITKTGLFGTDTWTTSKAVTLRAEALQQMALRETPSLVSQAVMPYPTVLPRW